MKAFVENLLPAGALLQQGIYLQSCAHLELLSWRIVQMVEGVDPNSKLEVDKFLKLRLRTRPLVDRLRASCTKCNAALGIRIAILAHEMQTGLPNRNMAAHGAWRLNSSGRLEVEHYLRGHDKTFKHITDQFTARNIQDAVDEVDRLLREAAAIHDQLIKDGKKFLIFGKQ